MHSMYIEQIENAFSRCYGLKESLKKYVEQKDQKMIDTCIRSLSSQAGIRQAYIRENLTEIVSL